MNSSTLRCVVCGFVLALCAPNTPSADLPVAPPPRVAKTKAELLIGRWAIIQVNDRKTADDEELINEYSKDGSFYTHRKSPPHPIAASGGTYKVVGDTIQCYKPITRDGNEFRWEIKITSISATEATFFQSEGSEKWVWHLKRLPTK